MTPRERILTILNGGKPDQVPWFADLDYWATALIARGERPKDFKTSDAYLDWHRELGAGFYLQGYFPFKEVPQDCRVENWGEGNNRYRTIETPKGTLRECWYWSATTSSEAPIERLVKTAADLPAYRWFYEHMQYEPDYAQAELRRKQIGDDGVVLCYTHRSPFMNMVAIDAGIEHVVELYMSAPDELAETLEAIKASMDRAVEIVLKSPAEIVMTPENLSAEVVGPTFFELFMRDYQTDWKNRIHAAGKFSCIHMDGTLRGLLRQEAAVGFTFIEALTPAPTGDLPVEDWAGFIGDSKTLAWGGIPGAYFTAQTSDGEFDRLVRHVLSVMRKKPRYVLGVADQVPPDGLTRRVKRVRELVDRYGAYES
jgi:uroporphyrinogen-III decarboxylase